MAARDAGLAVWWRIADASSAVVPRLPCFESRGDEPCENESRAHSRPTVRGYAACGRSREKLQKQLLLGSNIGMRTYQRAEEGSAISEGVLREIAALFKVPVADILMGRVDGGLGNTVRLHPCDGKGALGVLQILQGWPGELRVDFEVDANGDAATIMADVVRCCEMNQADRDHKTDLGAAEFIEAVGELNAKIAALYALGVNIHFTNYPRWETYRDHLSTGQSIRVPTCKPVTHIVFSEQSDVIHRHMSRSETYERVCAECHYGNYGHDISPEQLKQYVEAQVGGFANNRFVRAYEEYLQRRSASEPQREKNAQRKPLRLIESSES